jgi:TPR repeat protein
MCPRISIAVTLLLAAVLLLAVPAFAGMDEGITALKKNDFATAAKELHPLAEKGNPEAQYRVGLMYEFGKGFPMDKVQAVSWLRKSATQGHIEAQVEIAVIYATGDGVPQDDKQAVDWFRKAAEQGNVIAQYNLGLLYAKGQGIKRDDAQAIAWFRKSADQGYTGAQYKMGLAYEYGEGVAKDSVRAYANYAIAARGGNQEYTEHRDAIARKLSAAQLRDAKAMVAASPFGQAVATAGAPAASSTAGGSAPAAAPVARASDKCSATGAMEGAKFTATHCVVSLYGDAHSVAIWFNEDAITPDEAANFQLSSYASDDKGGKPRTLVRIMFCPGGGAATASATAVKSIDFATSNAKSPLAGVQWVVEAPKDFKVEKMTGEIKPGGTLAGRIVGQRAKTSWTLDFDMNLPTKDAAAGFSCGK